MSGPSSTSGVPHLHLKIAEIKGEARSEKHKGEIELNSWSWGETQSVFPSETRKSGGSVTMRDFQFEAAASSASSQFFLCCASAKRLKSAVLTCDQDQGSGRHIYLTITFSNVVIGSYEVAGSGRENHCIDRVTLKFTKIEFAYTPVAGGNFTSSWDLTLGAA